MNILKNSTILAIDDDTNILLLLKKLLLGKCKKLSLQYDPQTGLKLAHEERPDLILLDVCLGDVCGYDLCQQLKADEQTRHIPVIFLSSLSLPADKVKGFKAGGVDYIAKPFAIEEVLARIDSCLVTHKKIRLSAENKIQKALQPYQLNSRELEIINLYILGYKRSEIAEQVCLSENTIKWYLKQIFQKLEVDNRAALIEKCKI